jgi:hypothetical protein
VIEDPRDSKNEIKAIDFGISSDEEDLTKKPKRKRRAPT